MGLILAAVDVAGPRRWRWLLTDEETGTPLADHQVDLDLTSDEAALFADLYAHAWWRAAPDRRVADGAKIVGEAGQWAGDTLLGAPVAAAIAAAAEAGAVTVRVTAGQPADPVLLWPLELAHAGGKPLAAWGDVSFVYDVAPDSPARPKPPVTGLLRVLAVFSQPTETSVLALRRERYALSRLIRRIAARERALVELRVVQYGVTRARLKEIADDGDGWDVLHLSGHGAGGLFLLEKADGTPDWVLAADLLALLRPVRRRVKLAVVSACESAADTTAETYRLLGLTGQAEELEAASAAQAQGGRQPGIVGGRPATEVPGLGRALVRELGCAVVAMRYPVTDDFAIAFGDVLYEQLLRHRQPVDVAAARAVADAAGPVPTAARPAVSLATPGVFGSRAIGLRLELPRGRPVLDPAEQKMAYFPDEPARFVGRAAAMARASAALAPGSGKTGVLLHGMAGAGKTACALELAYRHRDAFGVLAFWQAPTRDDEWAGALADLANQLDIQLGGYGFTMASHIGTATALEAFLPRLRAMLADAGLLLVLDNLETLLTPDGGWRDPRWEPFLTALTSHDGESRVILTSRVPPAATGSRVVTLPVHTLSLGEAVAFARELPNLRRLLHADADPAPAAASADAEAEADRERVLRVLRMMQGHPKLMELADAAAVDRDQLDAQLAAAEHAAQGAGAGQGLEAFFRDGASTLEPAQFLNALSEWTAGALAVLTPAARLMTEFVSCLEDGDRRSDIIEANWGDLWRRLSRSGDPPEPRLLLEALAAAALVEPETFPVSGAGDQPQPTAYRMHPGVAAAVLAAAAPGIREAADTELASYWYSWAYQAREQEASEDSRFIARAGLAAAPYLLRLGEWDTAQFLLEGTVIRDSSPGTVQAALPALQRIVAATGTPAARGILARTLSSVDPAEAEHLMRSAIAAAAGAGDYKTASATSTGLVSLLRDAGRLAEAQQVAEQAAQYTRQAGQGPWTELATRAGRLKILAAMGENEQVLAEVEELRARMAELPGRPAGDEIVYSWSIREAILDAGHASAVATRDWQRCLDLNAEIAASLRQRGAGWQVVTQNRFNDLVPLIRLGRLAEAQRLLTECQQVFEDHSDIASLGSVLSTRADLENALGHWQAAADLQRAGLRLRYGHPDAWEIAGSHHNFANYLARLRNDQAGQRAHRLAAALIFRLTGMTTELADCMQSLAAELRADGADPSLPRTLHEVIATAELTEGVRLGALLAAIQPNPRAVEDAFAQTLRAAAALPVAQEWEPLIAAVAAACRSGQEAPELVRFLRENASKPDWAALVAVLRRILAGERGPSLLDGLEPIEAAIVRETLSRLTQDQ